MEKESEGVNDLIKQRTHRPSFARMISWEMSRGSSPKKRRPSRKSKRRKTSVVVEDDNDKCSINDEEMSSNSDSSVYLTAEGSASESENDVLDHIPSIPPVFSELSVNTHITSKSSDSLPHHRRRRRLSKKQKKRKRYKLQFSDSIFSCSNEDKCEFNPFDVSCLDVSDLREDSKHIKVLKDAPSLVELCLKCAWKSGLKFSAKPYGLMPKINTQKCIDAFFSLQLQMLHKHLNKLEDMKSYCMAKFWHYDGKEESDHKYIVCKAKRNIWNTMSIEPLHRHGDPDAYGDYYGCRASSFLRWTSLSLLLENQSLCNHLGNWHSLVPAIAVLGHTIDLMLPATISNRTNKFSKDEKELNDLNCRGAVGKVKHALKARFPTLVEKLFDETLAYTFWARGSISQAAELFIKIANEENDSAEKAMFFGEVARMYAQLDDQHLAKKFFRIASDWALEKARIDTESDMQEINQQLLVLMANAFDQGLMTEEKACEAASLWNSVYNQKNFPVIGLKAAFDSFLCFHCGSFPGGVQQWLSEAESKLKSLVAQKPCMYLYYSLVLAWQGKEKLSHCAFREYCVLGVDSEDELSDKINDEKCSNIWKHLVNEVQNKPVSSMRVIWRTQFQNVILTRKEHVCSSVTDYCDSNLQLRISSDGHVIGNMQQFLPPLRGILLDPYTGQRVIKSNPSKTVTWGYANPDHTEYLSAEKLFLPTPQQIYCDDNGNRVQMVCSCEYLYGTDNLYSNMMTLHWSNSEGETEKVNVMSLVRKIEYDFVFNEIQDNGECKKSKEIMEKTLNILHAKGMTMRYKTIEEYLESYTSAKKKANEKGIKFVKPKIPKAEPLCLEVNTIVQYGETLFLHIGEFSLNTILLFFNCTSAESFKNFKTHARRMVFNSSRSDIPNLYHNKVPGNVLWFSEGSKTDECDECVVYDHVGNLLSKHPAIDGEKTSPAISTPYVLGDKLYGVNEDKNRILIMESTEEDPVEAGDFEEIKELDIFGGKIVLRTEEGICFLDPETLSHQKIQISGKCPSSFCLDEKSTFIKGQFSNISLLQMIKVKDGTRCVVAFDSFVCIIKILPESSQSDTPIIISLCVSVPGLPREAQVPETMGLIVATSINEGVTVNRENVYYYDRNGQLVSLLPMLGPGQKSFCLYYFPKNEDLNTKNPDLGKGGLHLFMNDGHGGIIGILLVEE